MIDKGPFENHPPGAGYHWSIRLFINIHHPIFGIPIPCRFYSHLRPYYFKPNVCTVNVFCCWPWHPHWMHFWEYRTRPFTLYDFMRPRYILLWFYTQCLTYCSDAFGILSESWLTSIYKKMYENWVYPQNSILFMGDVMVNQWIDKYQIFRQTHMQGVMMRYKLHVGMHLSFLF